MPGWKIYDTYFQENTITCCPTPVYILCCIFLYGIFCANKGLKEIMYQF